MADEAFALSPISARSASPSDADYDAIREAFMETARGRSFLGEYAKRNRNADTAMVLDVVARLEQSLAASRAETAAIEPPAHSADTAGRDEILASVKMILDRTRAALEMALSVQDMEKTLSPFRCSARIIQEIAWGLRESGSDGRICNILDAQVRAMITACETLAAAEHRDAILHAFDASLVQIEKLAECEAVASAEEPAAKSEISETIIPEEVDASVIDVLSAAPTIVELPTAKTAADDLTEQDEAAQPSLGASLMAHGIVAQAATMKTDPLAPIRRMSQAEKIAFFS